MSSTIHIHPLPFLSRPPNVFSRPHMLLVYIVMSSAFHPSILLKGPQVLTTSLPLPPNPTFVIHGSWVWRIGSIPLQRDILHHSSHLSSIMSTGPPSLLIHRRTRSLPIHPRGSRVSLPGLLVGSTRGWLPSTAFIQWAQGFWVWSIYLGLTHWPMVPLAFPSHKWLWNFFDLSNKSRSKLKHVRCSPRAPNFLTLRCVFIGFAFMAHKLLK